MVAKAEFDRFASDAAYIQDDLAYLKAEAQKASQTLENYLKTVIKTGTAKVPFIGLEASTDYYAYVYGITDKGVVTSPLTKTPFKTAEASVDPEGLTFTFEVTNITRTAADVNVIPSNNEDTYYFDISPVAAFEGMTEEEILAEVIDGLTADDLSQGPDGLPAELIEMYAPFKPGTDYYVYAVGFDPAKGATTALSKYKFTTEAATGAAPELTLTGHAGDQNGTGKSNNVTCMIYSPDCVSGLFVTADKRAVDDLLGKGATLEQLVDANGKAFTDERIAQIHTAPGLPITFIELSPETTYTTIIKVTGEGGLSTVKSIELTTEKSNVQPSDMTFTYSVSDITATSAKIVITPSSLTETYFYDIQKKSVVDSFGGNLADLIAAFNQAYAQYGGVGGMLSTGEETYLPTKLLANTTYTVVAFGYTDGVATTALSTHEFTTESAATSDLTFQITVDDTQPIPGGVTATITPSNNDETYLMAFTLADEIDALTSDAEIVAYYEEMYGMFISWATLSGVYETMPTDFRGSLALMPGADHYIVAFGYGESGATTDVYKTRFVAGAGPDPAGTTFTFSVSELTASGATVEVTPSKEPVTYMWDILSQADFAEIGGETGIPAFIAAQFEYYAKAFTPRQIIAGLGAWYMGASYDYSELDPETVYVPFAVCVDLEGNVVDTPVVGETFTTLAATAPASAPKFFGRYEVGDLRPRIYRPMDRRTVSKQFVEALVRSRAERSAAVAPARVRGVALPDAVRVEAVQAFVQELTAPSAAAVSPRRAMAQPPHRATVRTPRR